MELAHHCVHTWVTDTTRPQSPVVSVVMTCLTRSNLTDLTLIDTTGQESAVVDGLTVTYYAILTESA